MNLTFVYLAAVYAGAVWLCNRSSQRVPWKFAAFFYALVLIALFRPLTMHFVDLPVDYIYRLYPWRGAFAPLQRGNSELNDLALQMLPWAHLVRESWKHFEAPLWNASAGAGYPLLANAQSAALSPLRLLALPLSLAHSFAFEAGMKLLIALTGGFLYMRRRAFSDAAAVMTAISFAFSTFISGWLHFPHATTVCWMPAIFLAIDLLFERITFPRFVLLAALFTVMLFSGHPESAAFVVIAASLYVAWLIAIEEKRKALRASGVVAGAGLVSVLLASPFLLPFFEALQLSQRFEQLQHAGPRVGLLEARALITFINPDFFGSTHAGNLWGPGITEFVSGYAGVFGVIGFLAVLFNVLREMKWRRFEIAFLLMTILFLGIVMGWPLFGAAYDSTPFLWRAAHGRLRAPLCWALAVLAGCAVDLFRSQRDKWRSVAAATAGAALLALPFFAIHFPNDAARDAAFYTSVLRVTVAVIALAAAFLASRNHRVVALLVIVTAADLVFFSMRWNPDVREELMYPSTRLLGYLERGFAKRVPNDISLYRIAATGGTMFPNLPSVYGYEDIRSHDPMANTATLGALKIFAGYTSDDYFAMLRDTDHPLMDFLNVRYIIAAPQEILPWGHYSPVYSSTDGRIYQNTRVLPRFYAAPTVIGQFNQADLERAIMNNRDWANNVIVQRLPSWLYAKARDDLFAPVPPGTPRASVKIENPSPRDFRLHIVAPRWTLIASSQPFWPGWRIWDSAGKEVKLIAVNGSFIGFLAPPGVSDLRLVYNPRSFYVGRDVSLATVAILFLFYLRSRRRRTRSLQSATASL